MNESHRYVHYNPISTMSDENLAEFAIQNHLDEKSLTRSANMRKAFWPAYTFVCGVVVGMLIVVLLVGGPQ